MPEDIVAFITRDGRQLPLMGTLVREDEVTHFSAMPDGLKFYLASTGEIMVHLTRQNRWLPAEHAAVKAYILVLLQKGKRRKPTREEFDFYWQRCLASALENPLSDEQAAWSETVVLAIEELMWQQYHRPPDGGREYKGKLMS